jgi:hypothetical protein
MHYTYCVVRNKFLKHEGNLTLPAGQRIVQVIDKMYESDGVILVMLIEKEV